QLLGNGGQMLRQGDDVNLGRDKTRGETLVRQSKQTLALNDAEQLFWPSNSALRPEPRARSARPNDRKVFPVSTIQDWSRPAYNYDSCPTHLKLSSSIERSMASAAGAHATTVALSKSSARTVPDG